MAHYDIFRHNLAIKYPACGHALWEPSPGGRYPAVAVGDVGFIREGRFHRLFNILLPPKDPSHRIFGVPDDSEDGQLRPQVDDHKITGTLNPNHFCSAGVALESEPEVQANEPKGSTAVSFSCRRKQGAVLSLPVQARCEDTVALGDFRKWMINHIDLWFSWAQRLGVGITRMEDIVLVTGAHLTRSWTNVAFLEDQTIARASFEFQVAADTSINWHISPDRVIGALLNHGPIGKDLPEDQCIFIRGFRVTRKLMILPRTLKGAAGPNPDDKGSDSEPEVKPVPISNIPEYRDPLHILLEYIAESIPECDMVLVHDDDLVRLDGFGDRDDTSPDILSSGEVAAQLRQSKPEIREVLFHPDLSSGSKDANADTKPVRVAMLSGPQIFEGHPPLPSESATSSRPVAPTITHNLTPSQIGHHEALTSDVLVNGFIARTFTPEDASDYFRHLLNTPPSQYLLNGIVSHQGAWYIMNNDHLVQGTSPSVPLLLPPLLDYDMRVAQGTVVPQRRWTPADEVDVRRFIERAFFQLPIFFVNRNGGLGFELPDILRGCDHDLRNADTFASLGGGTTTHIRINWPGYGHWRRQIATRDETRERNPITVARFMRHVARTVDIFFRECISNHHVVADRRWQIGPGGITADEVKIIGAIHVAAGSWMPIIQLTRYVF